jgi:putative transposase
VARKAPPGFHSKSSLRCAPLRAFRSIPHAGVVMFPGIEKIITVMYLYFMAFNLNSHKRKSIRLKGYDYSKQGLYYITICCHGIQCYFGKIVNNEMILNEYGKIANDEWIKLSERFQNFELNIFQIMPNHMHGIIVLSNVGAPLAGAPDDANATSLKGAAVNPAPTVTMPKVGDIVGAYKSLVANGCLEIFKTKNEIMGKLWQRNYYEHIIRNDKSYQRIYDYILNNPANWKQDKLFN